MAVDEVHIDVSDVIVVHAKKNSDISIMSIATSLRAYRIPSLYTICYVLGT